MLLWDGGTGGSHSLYRQYCSSQLPTLDATSREVSIAQSDSKLSTQAHRWARASYASVCSAAITLLTVLRLMRLKLQPQHHQRSC